MSQTIRSLWATSLLKYPDLPALGYVGGEPYTYTQVDGLRRGLQASFQVDGIAPGARIALLGENMPHWGVAYLAVTTGGWTVVPVLPEFSRDEVENILHHSGSELVIVSKRLWPKVAEFVRSGAVRARLMDSLAPIPAEWDGKRPLDQPGLEGKPQSLPEVQDDDVAAIIYTSGTTGQSKGVMLTQRNIASNAETGAQIPHIRRPGQRMISILPLSHSYECTLGFLLALVNGFCIYYLDRPPSASVLLPALRRIRPHLMLSVPLLIEKIYRSSVLKTFQKSAFMRSLYGFPPTRILLNRLAGRKLKRTFGGKLHFFGIGGAKIAEDVERFLREAKFPYAVGYGLTETSPLCAGTNAVKQTFRSTGPAIDGVDVRIADPDPESGEGEIQVRGPNVMKGYYKDEEKTKAAFTADGWFRTGDTGVFDKRGNLFIRGRIKTMILGPSGENIYPEAIEAVINEFEFVEESLVLEHEGRIIARVHLNYDEIAKTLGKMKDDVIEGAAQVTHDVGEYLKSLRDGVNKRLAAFSRIAQIHEEKEPFVKTPTKKIKRYLYEGGDTKLPVQEDEDDGQT